MLKATMAYKRKYSILACPTWKSTTVDATRNGWSVLALAQLGIEAYHEYIGLHMLSYDELLFALKK